MAVTGLTTAPETGLPHDLRRGTPELGYEFCWIRELDIFVTAARIPSDSFDLKFHLPLLRAEALPTPLGGGWRGFTDGVNTTVVLPCVNSDEAIAVTAQLSSEEPNKKEARKVADLVTATAAKASGRWGCETKPGTHVPVVAPATDSSTMQEAAGTCAGLPGPRNKKIDKVAEAPPTGSRRSQSAWWGDVDIGTGYRLQASFGPYAQRERGEGWDDGMLGKPAGGGNKDA
ncbi:hypothetical protein ACFWY6_34865 [Streptomyces sp. NPDC059037]|uniref:hypothetical protein n=1 Tax=Streptomyces sp. NPDC059037 TaxID=3346710 RepID=UPI003693A7EF